MKKILTAFLFVAASNAVLADDVAIKNKLQALGAQNIEINASPIAGIKTVITDEGILYITEDGKYALQGKLYELTAKGPLDVNGKMLINKLNSFKNEMIIYPAKNEKHVVTVFMDITCHYCHLLHQQIKEYNDLGITVRYLAFPRAGMNAESAKQMEPADIDRILAPAVRAKIVRAFREFGFSHVSLDLLGYRKGSMNEGVEGI